MVKHELSSNYEKPRVGPVLGPEAARLDVKLGAANMGADVRNEIWASAQRVLAHGPISAGGSTRSTGMAIGYVQSGKTTAFTALMAKAVDAGFRIVVALLGSTNLLLDQNSKRLTESLELDTRIDYRWLRLENPNLEAISPRELSHYVGRGRIVLATLLKHSGRIDQAARLLTEQALGGVPVLIVDDEADQVSLNTRVKQGDESPTYAALQRLRNGIGPHLYVQYTATPYAPLLLEVEDFLSPDFVELLKPGPGYVGGLELLVENRATVVREIADAPAPNSAPAKLPASLRDALAEFVVGAALLLGADPSAAPVSMLVHPSGRVAIHRRYEFLVDRCLVAWRKSVANGKSPPDVEFDVVRARLVAHGCRDLATNDFWKSIDYVLGEATIWRINSAEDANRTVRWNVAPVHVLIGGNKLDRGFTVEGLTVSWLGRQPSIQLDTMVQRARAYGYRQSYLPYCKFYASVDTLNALTSAVDTDLDMRARLRDWLEEGRAVKDWASDVGLVLGPGLQPTRAQVVNRMTDFRAGWHMLARPSSHPKDTARNMDLLDKLGLIDAPQVAYGRLTHRTLDGVAAATVLKVFLEDWAVGFAPGWDIASLKAWLTRMKSESRMMPVLLLTAPGDKPRERAWDERLGFEQLMQGRDPTRRSANAYVGDRDIVKTPHIQVHLVKPAAGGHEAMLALAVLAGDPGRIIRRGG